MKVKYLTRISCPTVSGPYHDHRVIEALFDNGEPETGRKALFTRRGETILAVSEYRPNGSCFDDSVTVGASEEASVPEVGKTLVLRTVFCPAVHKAQGQGSKSKDVGIWEEEESGAWLTKRLEKSGAKVLQLATARIGFKYFQKADGSEVVTLAHNAVGVVQVEDAGKFWELVSRGVGGCKFAGFGMLDIFG
jgi:CRISPR-associated protein Cas6/Cse3/CasE subtype I-E